jgi:hypothetical protein
MLAKGITNSTQCIITALSTLRGSQPPCDHAYLTAASGDLQVFIRVKVEVYTYEELQASGRNELLA